MEIEEQNEKIIGKGEWENMVWRICNLMTVEIKVVRMTFILDID